MSSKDEQDKGVLAVLVQRFETYRLPRALALKERVDRGEVLTDSDLAFLERIFAEAQEIMPIVDRHPDHRGLAMRAVDLYTEITKKALENEERAKPSR